MELEGSPRPLRRSCLINSHNPGLGRMPTPLSGPPQHDVVCRCYFDRALSAGIASSLSEPRYRPMTRLTTLAAMPASTALAIGDDRMSVIGLDPDACC